MDGIFYTRQKRDRENARAWRQAVKSAVFLQAGLRFSASRDETEKPYATGAAGRCAVRNRRLKHEVTDMQAV